MTQEITNIAGCVAKVNHVIQLWLWIDGSFTVYGLNRLVFFGIFSSMLIVDDIVNTPIKLGKHLWADVVKLLIALTATTLQGVISREIIHCYFHCQGVDKIDDLILIVNAIALFVSFIYLILHAIFRDWAEVDILFYTYVLCFLLAYTMNCRTYGGDNSTVTSPTAPLSMSMDGSVIERGLVQTMN